MNFTKINPASRSFISLGLIALTLAVMLKNYIPVPDFAKGFLIGLGLVFQWFGLVKMSQNRNSGKRGS